MAIFVTDEPNDKDLLSALGSTAKKAALDQGDCVFWGKWIGGSPVAVCVERKRIRDMVNSIHTGRYFKQAQDAAGAGFNHLCLIVEGEVKASPDGLLMTKTSPQKEGPSSMFYSGGKKRSQRTAWYVVEPKIMYYRFSQYLDELTLYCGILVKQSANVSETAEQVKALWQLFQRPPEDHSSLESIYRQPPPRVSLLRRPSLMRRIAAELPHIGWDKSEEIENHFHSIGSMIKASSKEWMKVPGVGKKIAEDIVAAVNAYHGDGSGIVTGNGNGKGENGDGTEQ